MNPTLQPTSVLARSAGNLQTEIDGEVVLMSMEQGSCYGLDAVGSTIWAQLERPAAVAAVQAECCEQYEGDAQQIKAEVLALLQQLLDHGLVEVQSA